MSKTLAVTATPEWIAQSLLTIARQPGSPDDDAQWRKMVVDYITQRTPLERAAPDLLAACEAIVAYVGGSEDFTDAVGKCRDAIARAKGAEPTGDDE